MSLAGTQPSAAVQRVGQKGSSQSDGDMANATAGLALSLTPWQYTQGRHEVLVIRDLAADTRCITRAAEPSFDHFCGCCGSLSAHCCTVADTMQTLRQLASRVQAEGCVTVSPAA